MSELSHDILTRCKDGDTAAFRTLVESHQTYAFSLALRVLCDEDEAKDVVQESFIRVWKHIGNFKPRERFTTWLYRIVTNLCYDRLKMKARKTKVISGDLENSSSRVLPDAHDLDRVVDNKTLVEIIRNIASGLTHKQRIVFVLRDLQDLNIGEVSDVLKMSKNSVKSNLYYARQKIRKELELLGITKEVHNEMQTS